jgi:ADP-ribose pyrophosphatase YjhB (NUDIX family)
VNIDYIVITQGIITDGERFVVIVRSEQDEYYPGVLTFPGGRVEAEGNAADVLEETVRRELREEVGLDVGRVVYLMSELFTDKSGGVISAVFLCEYVGGEPAIGDPNEVAAALWLTAAEIIAHPRTPPRVRSKLAKAQAALGRGALASE